jgi:hypothetical protein
VGEFRDEGFLPEAMVNFLALLGWNEGDGSEREIYSLEELQVSLTVVSTVPDHVAFACVRLQWGKSHSASRWAVLIQHRAGVQSTFSLGRITKSGAVFDKAKLSWMNGEQGAVVCLLLVSNALCLHTRVQCGTVHHVAAVHAPGQYLRAKPDEELIPQLAGQWAAAGLIKSDDVTPFVTAAVQAAKKSLVSDMCDASMQTRSMARSGCCHQA